MPAPAIIHQLVAKFNDNRAPQEQLRREIASTDRQIDALVYQLYGLTDEEIKIVEGSN